MKDKVLFQKSERAAAQLKRYVAAITRCVALAIFVSTSAGATESQHSLAFYQPVDITEIVRSVKERQKTLGVREFLLYIPVQFGTRDEWTNACAWLAEQTEEVSKLYTPRQDGVDETRYICGVHKEGKEISEEWVSELRSLIDEFVNQFGGAEHAWRIVFDDESEAPHNNTLERTGEK